jgi:hypothetical protein
MYWEGRVFPLSSSDSQHFKSLRRGVLRAFWGLKTENGVFFGQEAFLGSTFSFFLDFLSNVTFEPLHESSTKGRARQGGELPRFVPNKPMC